MDIFVIVVVIFLTTLLVSAGAYYTLTAVRQSPRSEVKRRLHAIALKMPSDQAMPQLLKNQIMSEIPAFNRLLFSFETSHKAERLLDRADMKMKVGTFFITTAVLAVFGLILGLLLHRGIILTLALGIALPFSLYFYLVYKAKARVKKFTEHFPNALDMIARSLRAGHSFLSAIQVVSEEMPDPVAKVFRIAYDEQNLGLSLSESLANMTERIQSLDINFFVTAVNIQRETGGNLAETLDKLAHTIRERFKILGQLRVYTAQGRLSGYLLALLPIVMGLVLWIIHPGYLVVLFTEKIGLYMIAAAAFMQLIGLLVIRKIINIMI